MCWPQTYSEVAAALAVADRVGAAVSARGAGTKTELGNPPRACDLIVSTERLNRVVEYAPANLTVTVEAGMPLAALQATLAAGGQRLTLDPPYASAATVGGVIATNATGPRRLAFGGPRDLVIGTRAATTSGTVVRSGGRVVKNVAGYDLNKLYVGSLGTLVVLVEVGFKVAPLADAQVTVVGRFCRIEQLAHAVTTIVRSPLQPVAVDVLNPAAARLLDGALIPQPRDGFLLAALGAAPGGGVARQRDEFARMFAAAGGIEVTSIEGDDVERFWSEVAEWPSLRKADEPVVLKAAVPPAALSSVVPAIEARLGGGDRNLAIGGRAASGIIYVRLVPTPPALNGSLGTIVAGIQQLRKVCQDVGGSLVVEQAPLSLKRSLDVWGDVGSGLPVMRQLKAALDPNGILNPGRFVGGI